jgi:hypothetical protein
MDDMAVGRLLASHPGTLNLSKLIKFVLYSASLKRDILLAQPAHHSPSHPPDFLPLSIVVFLSKACEIKEEVVRLCWDAVKQSVWDQEDDIAPQKERDFREHGYRHGLSTCLMHPRMESELSTCRYSSHAHTLSPQPLLHDSPL